MGSVDGQLQWHRKLSPAEKAVIGFHGQDIPPHLQNSLPIERGVW